MDFSYSIHASTLGTWADCPRRAYLNLVKERPPPKARIATLVGNAVHAALARMIERGIKDSRSAEIHGIISDELKSPRAIEFDRVTSSASEAYAQCVSMVHRLATDNEVSKWLFDSDFTASTRKSLNYKVRESVVLTGQPDFHTDGSLIELKTGSTSGAQWQLGGYLKLLNEADELELPIKELMCVKVNRSYDNPHVSILRWQANDVMDQVEGLLDSIHHTIVMCEQNEECRDIVVANPASKMCGYCNYYRTLDCPITLREETKNG